jgi:Ser/Thr protein kinase RdoA (MazF antagonist)
MAIFGVAMARISYDAEPLAQNFFDFNTARDGNFLNDLLGTLNSFNGVLPAPTCE